MDQPSAADGENSLDDGEGSALVEPEADVNPNGATPVKANKRKHRRVVRAATGGVSSADQIVTIRREESMPMTGLTAAEQRLIDERPPHW